MVYEPSEDSYLLEREVINSIKSLTEKEKDKLKEVDKEMNINQEIEFYQCILALSANLEKGTIEKAFSAGVDDYMAKPFTLKSFYEKYNLMYESRKTRVMRAMSTLYTMKGMFNMHGVEKEVSMNVEFTGTVVDPWGQVKSGFEITGSLNRSEFGLTWNATSEDGSIVLDEVIKLALNVQMIKQV